MAGIIKQMLDEIYLQRAGNNQAIVGVLNVKLVLKGVYPDIYTETSPDDDEVISKVKTIADDMGVRL
jgi:hypothetical protein